MKQQRDEQLSALLDNALDEQQLESFMQDLKRDPIADTETTQRYHLIGDAMRDELDQTSFMDVSSAIHRAIEHEEIQPTLKASTTPAKQKEKSEPSSFFSATSAKQKEKSEPSSFFSATPAKQKEKSEPSSFFSNWFKPVAGMAVAASVAMVTLVTFNNVQNSDSNNQPAQLAQVAQPPVQHVNPEIARNVQVASTLDISKKTPEQQKQLNDYLLQHSGYAIHSTIQQGMVPYVGTADIEKNQEK